MIRRGKQYKADEIIAGVCTCLETKEPQTPASLAKCVGVHPATAGKYVGIAENLGILKCSEVKLGRNKLRLCKINPSYERVWKKLRERGGEK